MSVDSSAKLDSNAVAITAVAGRFPGAATVEAFWTNLRAGVESVRFFSDDELRAAGVSVALLANPNYVKARPQLNGVDRFDAAFFGIPPREAELMDPQHRLLLEVAHEALERAALSPDDFDGLVGVFASAAMSAYLLHHLVGHPRAGEAGGVAVGLGNFQDFVATRLSYKLNLRGPAFSIQTACSSSLVAVHTAVQSLLNLECDAALAGGAFIPLPQDTGYLYSEEGVTSPDGHCRPFDAAAAGTVFGSGVGLVVLRRLTDAVRHGDPIIAVIKGSAVNNDGAIKAGFTAPAVSGQAEVISEALANAGVSADEISYVEGHGTATPLGDPIEMAALTQAFRETSERVGYCALGSVKGNIGHLDVAAGVTGLIKTALALQHGELPASLHFTTPNPKIDFAGSPFRVNAALTPWPAVAGQPRRAGVSAFGVGGTNAHVVLEEAPAVAPVRAEPRVHVLPLSAKSAAALDVATKHLAEHLARPDAAPLGDAALTLQTGRRAFEYRRVVVAATAAEARAALTSLDATRVTTGAVRSGAREVAFLFPGQGAQSVGMGRDLYAAEPVFRAEFDRCAELFKPALGEDLRTLVHPADGATAAAEARLNRTDFAQPALFAIEYALARLWISWGVKPAALLGHSLGEVTAACVAGVFTLEDAVRLVASRGRLMQALPEGALLAVTMAPAELKRRLNAELSLAIVNGPTACVVAGAPGPVAVLEDTLRSEGVPARRLPATHAFQSHLMEPVVAPLLAELRTMTLRAPTIPFLSNGSGRWISAAEATSPEYWAQQCRRTVYFGDGLRELAKEPNRLFVEVGPGRILAGLLRPNLDAGDARVAWASLPDARERKPEVATLLGTVGRLWTAGVTPNWRVLGGGGRRKTLLPTYPFESQRFWIDPAPAVRVVDDAVRREAVENWFYAPVWRQSAAVTGTAALRGGDAFAAGTAWIVTTDPAGQRLAAALRERGVTVIERAPRAAWEDLLASARSDGRLLKGIYAGDFLTAKTTAEAEGVFLGLLALAPALVAAGDLEPLRLLMATDRVHRVCGGEALTTAGALAAGLAQVLPRELPFVDARQIDFDSGEPATESLLAEAITGDGERLAAWRGGLRWVPQFERLTLPDPADDVPLRERGVYLITGGFGGIGLVAAEMLARRVKARLVLAGRKGGAGREQAIAQLTALGAEVLPVVADIGTREGVAAMFAAAEAKWGAVHGVIHAAGVPGRTIAARKTRAEAETVFAPKLRGAEAIAATVGEEGRAVDFVLFCSSLAVWAGSAGQSDYVAANAFLDAQARVLAASGVRAVSANWDLWSGVGMGAQESKATDLAITPSEGASALARVLGSPWPGVAVSTAELPRRFATVATSASADADVAAGARYPRPALATDYAAPAVGVEQTLSAQWQAILGLDRVGANDNFFELGGDSLTAMQAIARIKAEWAVVLPVTTFYDAPTARALAGVFADRKTGR